jgi:hypothetical protein
MCALAEEHFSRIAALANVRFTSKIYASLDAHSVAFLLHRFAYREVSARLLDDV